MNDVKVTLVQGGQADSLLAQPNADLVRQALGAPPAELRKAVADAALVGKRGENVAALLDAMAVPVEKTEQEQAAQGSPCVVLALGAEDPMFLNALLAYCGGWLAAGALLACRACTGGEGAVPELIVYTGDLPADAKASLRAALEADALETGLSLLAGPSSVVLREESALYSAMEGGLVRSELLDKAFPLQGWQGRSTLILDGETACWLAAACLSAGAPAKQGKLVVGRVLTTAGGALGPAGDDTFAQFAPGTTLSEAARVLGLTDAVTEGHPLLLGGAGGRFVEAAALEAAPLEYGHDCDTLRAFDERCCMADVGRTLTKHASELSCGKCVLCREGSWQLSAILSDIAAGRGKKTDLYLVADIGGLISLGSFCDFGRRMARPAMGVAALCRGELEAHIVRKNCPAGVCAAFANYVIDPKLCTGCGECVDVCDADAIEGKDGYIHIIDADYCEKCGRCVDVCEAGAARVATGKIKLPPKPVKVGTFK